MQPACIVEFSTPRLLALGCEQGFVGWPGVIPTLHDPRGKETVTALQHSAATMLDYFPK